MRIPLPCRFGESALCNGRSLPLMGVEWFEWTKGMEYTYFIKYKNSKTYMEFIMSNYYFAHIQVQCDENGMYLPDGEIIFPMSWDEKKRRKQF